MRIAVNTRLLQLGKLDGIGWFTFETLTRITRNNPLTEFFFIFDRNPHPSLAFPENVKKVILSPPTRHPLLWYLWFEWRIPSLLKKIKPDLFLSPDGYLSLKSEFPQLAVIHDLNFMHRPGDLPFFTGSYYRHFFPKFARKAARIATVSEFSKQDISLTCSVSTEKIDVVYNGANAVYSPADEISKLEWKKMHTDGNDYFIYVGTLHPRKNIDGMLLAFEDFKKSDANNMKLVIVGESMFKTGRSDRIMKSMKYRKDVIRIGRMNPDNLKLAIGSSRALILVSHFEGFGIPVLEALKCQVPVICSDSTSLPEVAGEAALLVNPASMESIAEAMQKIAADDSLHQELVKKGIQQANKFSWDKTAGLLWNSIERSL